MKRFALLVGVLALSASAYAAEDTTEFKNSGEFRLRYQNNLARTAREASGQNASTAGRLKWNVSARKGEKAQAYLSLINNNTFGSQGSAGGAGNSGNGTTGQSATTDANGLAVNRAWGWWKASDSVAVKAGRLGIEIGDGAVFSENDWEAYPTAHDGLNAAFDTGFAALNFYAVKQVESSVLGATAGNTDPERNFYLVSADFKNMPEAIKVANLFLMHVNRDAYGAKTAGFGGQNFQVISLNVGGEASAIMYDANAVFQTGSFDKPDAGTETKLNASMFDVMVGYHMAETMGFKVSLGYHMDSGDDSAADDKNEQYQPLFWDQHNYAGLMDLVNWGNLSYFNLNLSIMPAEDLETGLGAYMFSKTKENGGSVASANYGGPAMANKKDVGTEIDLYANKSYSENVKMGARFGYFIPGAAVKEATTPNSDKAIMDFMLQASLGF